ncbi:DivIVA domain-containing protein [Deinococcus sonorensis]|uniref:DivIVA domain-containing protein n=2 Tax=Deinococcus sonorensis TaxID=309891 RepID=A0AAU7UB56_9DEIO
MKYTPLDVRHQEFPGTMGGYRRPEVRAFLSELADDIETLLHSRQDIIEHVRALETRLEEYRQNEDDLRRAVVSAERIGQELRENARKEAELIVSKADSYREQVTREGEQLAAALETQHQARSNELEAVQRARSTELEASYQARFAELEAAYQRRHHELEQGFNVRASQLEHQYTARHNELSGLLTHARQEYVQFLSQYRTLVGSFHDLAAQHPVPEPGLSPAPAAAEAAPSNARVEEQQFV